MLVRFGRQERMDLIVGVLRVVLMIGFIAVVIGLVAALFMIVFSIATGIDRKMQR